MGGNGIAGPVLVLGGAGFMAGHLLDALAEDACRIRVFDREPPPDDAVWLKRVEWCQGDFNSAGDVAAALEGGPTVFHMLATTDPKTSNDDPVGDVEANLKGTVRFLELARVRNVRKIVFASSGGTVYGIPTAVPVSEDHPTSPICSYGIHKLAIERYLHLYSRLHGLDYTVLRVSNAFGERQRPYGSQGVIAVFLHRALMDQPLEVWGDGSVVRDYVYVGDVADAFRRAALHAGGSRTFNIGSGHGLSVNQVIASIEALLGKSIEKRYLPGRPFDVPTNVLDISLATAQLGWRPRHSFEEGLKRTARWLERIAGLSESLR